MPWVNSLAGRLAGTYDVVVAHTPSGLQKRDACFLLGCVRMLPPELLSLHDINLVVHESALPAGRGFSPVAWQVLEGCREIPVSLFEANDEPDAGPIYLRDQIVLRGTELLPEIRRLQGQKTIDLVLRFLAQWPDIVPIPQSGAASFYRRRTRKDDELDTSKPLADLFDHLRIVNNEEYPAWFRFRGRRYVLCIAPMEDVAVRDRRARRSTVRRATRRTEC